MGDVVIAFAVLWLLGSLASSPSSPPAAPWTRPPARDWTDAEVEAFADAVEATGMQPAHVLHVYAAESGLDPSASNRAAWGLPQAQARLLRALGWEGEPSHFARLGVADQSPWIRKILASQIKGIGYVPASALELYVANFSPLAARDRREVIFRRDDPSEAKYYRANRALDVDQKGHISVSDLDRVLSRVWKNSRLQRTLQQLRRVLDARP